MAHTQAYGPKHLFMVHIMHIKANMGYYPLNKMQNIKRLRHIVWLKTISLPLISFLSCPCYWKAASQMHVAPQIAVQCPLLTIYARCCPRHALDDVIIHCRYQRLPLEGSVIRTFEYCSVCSDWTTVVFWGNYLVKLIIADVSQCFPTFLMLQFWIWYFITPL